VTQFTYFQQAGGFESIRSPRATYGLERIAMYCRASTTSTIWSLHLSDGTKLTYRDVFWQNEREQANTASTPATRTAVPLFEEYEKECRALIEKAPCPPTTTA